MWNSNKWQYSFKTPNLDDDNKLITLTTSSVDDKDDDDDDEDDTNNHNYSTRQKKYERLDTTSITEYTTEEVTTIVKTLFGSVQNVLQYGGPGTYLIAGPTNAGKTLCIEAMVQLAQIYSIDYELKPLCFTSLILFSSTDEISNDWAWARDHTRKVVQSDSNITKFLEIRKKEIIAGAKKLGCTINEYKEMYPMIIVVDDFVGVLNGTGANSPLAMLASKARHYGLYVMLLVQSVKQIGPGVRKNARCIIGFRLELSAIQDIMKEFYGVINNYSQSMAIMNHISVTYTPVIFVLNWILNDPAYNNITRKILCTPPFPFKFSTTVTWSDPNNHQDRRNKIAIESNYQEDEEEDSEADEEATPKAKKFKTLN